MQECFFFCISPQRGGPGGGGDDFENSSFFEDDNIDNEMADEIEKYDLLAKIQRYLTFKFNIPP